MDYQIHQLAELSGLTPRTLRHYDAIGLLRPQRREGSNYRTYGPGDVDRLQQVLFYRELGLPLEEIGRLLDHPDFDPQAALRHHLAALEGRRERLDRLIQTVRATLDQSERSIAMKDSEKFKGFKQQAQEKNEAQYGSELRSRYGEEQVAASNAKFSALSEEDYTAMTALEADIQAGLEACVAAGADPAGASGREIAQKHKTWLGYTWPSYSPAAHAGLAQMYVADPRFTAYYDARVTGCAAFLRDAITAFTR